MTVLQALSLGLIQGLTEFLPISSSGHLIFIPKLFGWADQGLAFDAVVHLGTLAAVVVYFRKRLFSLIKVTPPSPSLSAIGGSVLWRTRGGNTERGARLGWYILLSAIPAGLTGFVFGDWIEAHTRSAVVVAWSLIGWGIVLAAADGFNRGLAKHGATKPLATLTAKNVFFIAWAQAIALIPGTSRSGITMTAGLFSRLDRKSAAEFSFLMAIPVIALAGATKLIALDVDGIVTLGALPLLTGFVSAAASGLLAVWGLMKIIQRWSFMPFVVYRMVVGVMILGLL